MGQGFQFSPAGVIPIVEQLGVDATAMHGAGVSAEPQPYDPEAIPEEPVARIVPVAGPNGAIVAARDRRSGAGITAALMPPALVGSAITPRTVIKAARERLKEIKAELRRHEALKKERSQLERMLAATKKPLASLTPINSRRVG